MDLLAPALARVARVEAAAADALRPAEERTEDGWRLRYNHGVTRRGNSVLAERRGRGSFVSKLREVEAFYAARGIAPRFQISPASEPSRLDAELEGRGWRFEPGARVLWAGARPNDARDVDPDVHRDDRPDSGYLWVQEAITPGSAAWAATRAEALAAAGLEPWHLSLRPDDRPLSAVLGVHDRERRMVGLFSLATLPDARGMGAATRLLNALRAHAAAAGAEGVYLQVDVRNERALRLYARNGFAQHHRYDYRVADV